MEEIITLLKVVLNEYPKSGEPHPNRPIDPDNDQIIQTISSGVYNLLSKDYTKGLMIEKAVPGIEIEFIPDTGHGRIFTPKQGFIAF